MIFGGKELREHRWGRKDERLGIRGEGWGRRYERWGIREEGWVVKEVRWGRTGEGWGRRDMVCGWEMREKGNEESWMMRKERWGNSIEGWGNTDEVWRRRGEGVGVRERGVREKGVRGEGWLIKCEGGGEGWWKLAWFRSGFEFWIRIHGKHYGSGSGKTIRILWIRIRNTANTQILKKTTVHCPSRSYYSMIYSTGQ